MKSIISTLFALVLALCVVTGCRNYDVVRGVAGPASIDANEPGMQDTLFVQEALLSSFQKIQLGRLGIERAENLDLQLLAQKIFDDHERAYKQLVVIAHEEEIPLSEPSANPEPLINLRGLSGPEFDSAYLSYLLETHRDDIKKLEAAARNARNSQVRDFAARTLPAAQEHVRLAENVGDLAGIAVIINEPAGAERPHRDPFLQGDPARRDQFDQR